MKFKEKLSKVAEQTKAASNSVGVKLGEAGKIAKDAAKTIAIEILDQDGDEQLSQDDLKILSRKAVNVGKMVTSRTKEVISSACDTDLVRDAAAGAVIGAAVAVPVPLIGPVAGAAIGASVGVYANVTKGSSRDQGTIKKGVARKVAKKIVKPV